MRLSSFIGLILFLAAVSAKVFGEEQKTKLPLAPGRSIVQQEVGALRQTSTTFRDVARSVGPSVAHIKCRLMNKAIGVGSGVIVDSHGFILTSYHVVRNAAVGGISVTLADRREFEADLLSFDPQTDLAMLRIEAKDLVAAKLGDSSLMEVGDWVLAIGSPLGFQQSVTAGIISATGRDIVPNGDGDIYGFQSYIQTDAAIYEGNSGGPLVNLDGEVIAITHSKIGRLFTGLSFATPINFTKNVLESMKAGLGAVRGRLGAGLEDVNKDMAVCAGVEDACGAQVQYVARESTAEALGLNTGDIIVSLNGKKIKRSSELRDKIACLPVDEDITIGYIRQGKNNTTTGKLVAPKTIYLRDSAFLGVALINLTKVISDQLGLESPQGACIVSVDPNGIGKKVGLSLGMVIAAVNATPTPDILAYKNAIEQNREAPVLQLMINIRGKLMPLIFRRNESGAFLPAEGSR